MSGCCSAMSLSTSAIRARTELMFHEAILIVVTSADVATLFSLCERERSHRSHANASEIRKRPPLRGRGARADQAFVTQGIRQTPGNRGKPRALQNRTSI